MIILDWCGAHIVRMFLRQLLHRIWQNEAKIRNNFKGRARREAFASFAHARRLDVGIECQELRLAI